MKYNALKNMFGVGTMEHSSKKNLNYHIKTRIFYENPDFGPGVAKIMELVKETGSLSKAYNLMGLSSSKGWKILKNAEEDLGFPLIISTKGGAGGGKSELSLEGEDLLKKYQAFIADLDREAKKIFRKYFG